MAAALESENHCTGQMRLIIDQISMQQGRIVALEEEKKRRDQECGQLKVLVKDLDNVLYRSDFFPGLGWMLTRTTCDELSPKWPKDDWLRLKENHQERQFVRSEICRIYNFGEHGSSMGQFFQQYLKPIKMNDVLVDWKSMDLSYLMEDKYLKYFAEPVKKAKHVSGAEAVLKANNIEGDVRVQYENQSDFECIAHQFGIFNEWKDGVPRTAYKGVVVFRYLTSRRVFLVGPDSLRQLRIKDP